MKWVASFYNPRLSRSPVLYDTTLRDGEQTPGVAFSPEQKASIALALEEAGVRELEAGFPAVSEGEREAIGAVLESCSRARIYVLCRARREDIDLAMRCGAENVAIFTSVSELHLRYKMRRPLESVRREALDALEYAVEHGLRVSFSTEDATRTRPDVLTSLYLEAEALGARRVTVSDTAGVASPQAVAHIVAMLRSRLRRAAVAVHTHNDFGLATANALAGVAAGAEVVATTVNGIGERAGNASLEEVVMALEVLYGVPTGIRLEKLGEISELVARCSGIPIHPGKPIVGRNAFTHESGVHVAAVLENPLTYEPFLPELVGRKRRIVLGKHSGRRAVAAKLEEMGLEPEGGGIRRLLEEVKRLGEGGVRVTEDSLLRMAGDGGGAG